MRNPSAPQADVQSPQTADRFAAVVFTVWTGDDDLRSDSSAWVRWSYQGVGGTDQRCDLKSVGGDAWPNRSMHDVRCWFPSPKTYDELRGMTMHFEYNGHPGQGDLGVDTFAHNMDNWNVNGIRVVVKNYLGKKQLCLFYAHADPLVRMTKSVDSYDLKLAAC
jgi:hypothetical protein